MSSSDSEFSHASDLLPKAPEGWLEDALGKLNRASRELAKCETGDEVMRYAIRMGVKVFGFHRIGAWFFEGEDRKALVGSFGVGEKGEFTDERNLRIYDKTGSIDPMIEAWNEEPNIYQRVDHVLRTGPAQIVGKGVQVVAPLMNEGKYRGILSVDDLLGRSSVNDRTGYFLNQFALLVSALYFERKKREELKRMEEIATQAEQVKVDFLGMMSHEIRTPLNAIMGYSQLLCAESNSENTRSLARTIEENGDHLVGLINGMLDYAQLSGTHFVESFSPCDPVSIAGSTVNSFAKLAESSKVEVEYSVSGDFEGYVLADPVSYRQVLANLIQNAVKFTPENGKVMVHLQTRRKSEESVEFYIEVEDTGIGMSEKDLPEIFKPFKQLDSSLTRKAGGIGMGLAIVDRLVRGLGGTMKCESTLGKGTVFRVDFVFKLAESQTPLSNSPQVSLPNIPKRAKKDFRLLIAEDNEENLKVLASLLGHLGYSEIVKARNGKEARDRLMEAPFDILFLDIQMPEIDGLTLTHDLRAGNYGPINQEIPIFGVSAVGKNYDLEQCLITGMTDCLLKPVKLSELKLAVEAISVES